MEIAIQIIAGLALLALGGEGVIRGAVGVARRLGLSELLIGLTLVGFGTSSPELITSIDAALAGSSGIALGNVLGSNIYNILGIGGVTALIAPTEVPAAIAAYDVWVMIGASVLVLVLGRTGWRVGRREGAALLGFYGLYVWSIWPAA